VHFHAHVYNSFFTERVAEAKLFEALTEATELALLNELLATFCAEEMDEAMVE